MGGASSRTKGHNFERWWARQMRPHFPDARRGLQYRDGNEAPDVIAGPFLFECKRGKKTNPKAALKQATECQKAKGFYPIAVTKDDFEEPIVESVVEEPDLNPLPASHFV